MHRNSIFVLVIIFVCLLLLEISSFIVGKYLIPDSLTFNPSFSAAEQAKLTDIYGEYLELRDPILGWPSKDNSGWQPSRDKYGNRTSPGSRLGPNDSDEPPDFCISAYGDSFTWGAEVGGAEAWPYVLQELVGCPVGNFGVGGYGSDQAYMRYLRHTPDNAEIVFLNHLSENILRNVGQFRSLSYGYNIDGDITMFKPRFILDDDGELQLVPLPEFDRSEFLDVLANPGNYLDHEYFLPGGDTGLRKFEFPYTLSLLRAMQHFHVVAALEGKPWYMGFYDPDHPSEGLQITAKILTEFTKSATERGQVPIVSVIPTGNDLEYFVEHGVWTYQNLLDRLSAEGIDVLNFGPGVMERLGSADPCSLFRDCSSHFNPTGYRYIAEIAYEELERRGLLKMLATPKGIITEEPQPES